MSTALADRVSGPVLTPADPGYAEELSGFNTAVTHTPDIVVGATSPADVLEAVRFAREHGHVVEVQATGHGAHAAVTSGLLISTGRMRGVAIDPVARTATVEAGTRWEAVVNAAADHGLAPVAGASVDVGVVGYLLGGGLGPLARSHGFGSDWIESIDVVSGECELVEVDVSRRPDLFWALRGGKGGLGIVTGMRIRLAELPTLYAGSLLFAEDDIEAAARAWAEWTAEAPGAVTTSVAVLRLPDLPAVPEPLRGRRVLSLRFAYPGPPAEGRRFAEPLRSAAPVLVDALGELPLTRVGAIHGDPRDPVPVWSRGLLLSTIDQDAITVLLDHVGAGTDAPFVSVEVRHLGGATHRDVPEGSAVGGREAGFALSIIGVPDPALFATAEPAAADALLADLEPWISSETTINFAGRPTAEEFRRAWPSAVFARLAEVRRAYDPHRIFPYAP